MSQPDRSPSLSFTAFPQLRTPFRSRVRSRSRPRSHSRSAPRPASHGAPRGPIALLAYALAFTLASTFVLATAGCSGSSDSISDAVGGHATDPGCIAALKAVSTYGPRAVQGLATGRETVNKAIVHLLVLALDAAADASDQAADKQAITTLANIYEDYYVIKTNIVAIPAADLLRDTTDLDSVCKS